MSVIIEQQRSTYSEAWGIEQYAEHSPGEHHVAMFLEMAKVLGQGYSVLDAGCGSGKGALALKAAGCQVQMCDITAEGLVEEAKAFPFYQACLWHPLGPRVDYVYCCDVLEHIPTEFTMLTVSRLLEVARRGVFLSISLVPDVFGNWVGKPLHRTVQSFNWWRDNLNAIGKVTESRDLLHTGIYFVRPR